MDLEIENLLIDNNIRPTSVRILVWKIIRDLDYAFSLQDIEDLLPTMDKSTIFRALRLFSENDLLHELDDGSGHQKYCIHTGQSHHHEECHHVHLYCTRCGKTFCIKQEHIPEVHLPEGFVMESVSYIIRGLCPRCAKFSEK
ncbi:MAG: transcriptional repressor [Bacteroidales bacterium]|nr:transcriptional repressor [Bacteroidales bacterium]